MDSLKEVFSFSRAETIALCLLLAICLIGGGALIYENSRQSLPPQLIFESISAEPDSPQKNADDAQATSTSALAASLHSQPSAFKDSRNSATEPQYRTWRQSGNAALRGRDPERPHH